MVFSAGCPKFLNEMPSLVILLPSWQTIYIRLGIVRWDLSKLPGSWLACSKLSHRHLNFGTQNFTLTFQFWWKNFLHWALKSGSCCRWIQERSKREWFNDQKSFKYYMDHLSRRAANSKEMKWTFFTLGIYTSFLPYIITFKWNFCSESCHFTIPVFIWPTT